MDPVSLIVAAVVAGAASGAKDTASQVVKDGYIRLKGLLSRHKVDVAALENKPGSDVQRAALEETLTDALSGASENEEQDLLDTAQTFVKTLRDTPGVQAAVGVLGVDLAGVEAEFIRIQEVRSAGSAVHMQDVKTSGGIDIGVVEAGIDRSAGPQTRQ
ncbi:hypothetical protein [Kribbella lupini]|uniref:RHIM domain-containing protein n=1 Tax=Kribbella lupini TaxID=291602 RepID=A0ABN2B1M4_9ACTN